MSIRVLIAEKDYELSDLYIVGLENTFQDTHVKRVANYEDLKRELLKDSTYNLLISDYYKDDDHNDIFKFLNSKNLNTPTLIISSFSEPEFLDFENDITYHMRRDFLSKPFSFLKFEKIIKRLCTETATLSASDYKRINTEYYMRATVALCDTYVMLNEGKFVKVIKKGDSFTVSQIESYLDRDINYLYISNSDMEKYVISAGEVSFLKYEPKGSRDHLDIAQKSIMTLQRLVKRYGVSTQTIAVVDSYVSNLKKLAQGSVKLKKILGDRELMTNYLYDHCYLTSLFAVEILNQLDWGKKDNIESLIRTAAFHDILLDDERLARISTQEGLIKADLGNDLKDIVVNHGRMIAEILEKEAINDQNLYDILINHHERPDGSGFPRGLHAKNIKPLAAVFIVAHELAVQTEAKGYDLEESDDIVSYMQEHFSHGHCEKIVKIVEKILK